MGFIGFFWIKNKLTSGMKNIISIWLISFTPFMPSKPIQLKFTNFQEQLQHTKGMILGSIKSKILVGSWWLDGLLEGWLVG